MHAQYGVVKRTKKDTKKNVSFTINIKSKRASFQHKVKYVPNKF